MITTKKWTKVTISTREGTIIRQAPIKSVTFQKDAINNVCNAIIVINDCVQIKFIYDAIECEFFNVVVLYKTKTETQAVLEYDLTE